MSRWIILRLILAAAIMATSVNGLEGVHLPEERLLDGKLLRKNGVGVRAITFFGMRIKVYVAGFYSRFPLRKFEDVLACEEPKQFDFTFLRSVGQGRVTEAWQKQLEASVSHKYEGYEKDRDDFVAMFGAISSGGTNTIMLRGDETVVVDNGVHRGTIRGKGFQKAFLSMWFGEQPVADDLKAGLLGSEESEPVTVEEASEPLMVEEDAEASEPLLVEA